MKSKFLFFGKTWGPFLFGVGCLLLFALTVHGLPGNPVAADLLTNVWRGGGPFELSPERGRFAIVYSIVEDHSLSFSTDVARFVVPDLAEAPDGRFVSLFAPAVSFLVLPGYLFGRVFDMAQVGTFFIISLFAVANGLLIRAIAERLGATKAAASLGALAFLFGTPAFAYGSTLYQHHISVALLLLSIFLLIRFRGWISLACVWFLIAFSVTVDNPNFFFFIPVGFFALGRVFSLYVEKKGWSFFISWKNATSIVVMVIPIALFLYYNALANGDPLKLSGTLPSVSAIASDGRPVSNDLDQSSIENLEDQDSEEKSAIGFFKTRDMVNGLYVEFFSADRGTVWYAPVVFFGIFGLVRLYQSKQVAIANVFLGTILATVLLYAMWGDPWGGWAFGSRYLIPAYAVLGIGIGRALSGLSRQRTMIMLALFLVLFAWSVGVNTLGAITSSANPPQHEVLALEKISGKEQKYTIARNWQYLQEFGSKSFFYQALASHGMNAETYYWLLVGLILTGAIVPIWSLAKRRIIFLESEDK